MDRLLVRPGNALSGSVRVSGATKNSGCKQMAAALMAPGRSRLSNMPPVADLDVMSDVLRAVGATVEQPNDDEVIVDASGDLHGEAPYDLVTKMRASVNVLGPLLARCGEAFVAMPGGDNIGSRKLDMHFRGLADLGADIEVVHGTIQARCTRLVGASLTLDFPSVGATENLLTASVLADGHTRIENAAREPEITELAAFLNRMGAHITGAGTAVIDVEGVRELHAVDAEIMPDRIETGTFLMACAAAGGEITLEGARLEHVEMVARKLGDMGVKVAGTPEGIWVSAVGRPRAVDISTLPHPGFATDFMPLAMAPLTVADGTSVVTENVFDNRYTFVDELNRMGADVRTEGRHAVVRGVECLSGAPVRALDVRAGAALVLAGLAADGETLVSECRHIARGYVDLPGMLRSLGADVTIAD
ncbi:MAG: UDP-N-acetylglucosamine 1-carboxyvinyltransferase [Acidimicrobiia bacterium]